MGGGIDGPCAAGPPGPCVSALIDGPDGGMATIRDTDRRVRRAVSTVHSITELAGIIARDLRSQTERLQAAGVVQFISSLSSHCDTGEPPP